jgi:hypothetical protein
VSAEKIHFLHVLFGAGDVGGKGPALSVWAGVAGRHELHFVLNFRARECEVEGVATDGFGFDVGEVFDAELSHELDGCTNAAVGY